ncbi:MAG TPA: hypothetical protein VIL85_18095 [Thermomicrobiales bacterium]|jgi:hypothetical protein
MERQPSPRTADRADAFVRRQALWARLLDLFRHHRPTDDQLTQVSTLAEVAIDQVFSAYNLTEEQCDERHGMVKDYAECAALYGYVLGYWQARQEAANERGVAALAVGAD